MKRLSIFFMSLLLLASPAWAQTKKLMPLGDSITVGTGDSSTLWGYRDHLQGPTRLGIGTYDFVGPFTDPDTHATFDVNHAGIGGNNCFEVQDRLVSLLNNYFPKPNHSDSKILLHCGTNDSSIPGAEQATVDTVEEIIDAIIAHDPVLDIFVALIVPHPDDTRDVWTTTYNTLLEEMLVAKRATHTNVHIVDMNAAFKANASWETAYGWSGSHPNNTGYSVMANTWFACIDNNHAQYCDPGSELGWVQVSGTVYKKTVTTEPERVYWNTTLLTEGAGETTGVDANEWDWSNNVLYVNVGADPTTGRLEHHIQYIGWTKEIKNKWLNLANTSHSYWTNLPQGARGPFKAALKYLVSCEQGTCNSSYAQEAYSHVTWWCRFNMTPYTTCTSGGQFGPNKFMHIPSLNEVRARYADFAIAYDWVKGGLTSQQKADWRSLLEAFHRRNIAPIERTTGKTDAALSAGDSDNTIVVIVASWLHMLAIEEDDPTYAETIRTNDLVGDYYLSSLPNQSCINALGNDKSFTNCRNLRDSIYGYKTVFAGGQWLEGSSYSAGTLAHVLPNMEMIRDTVGLDPFPEYTAEEENFAKVARAELVPYITGAGGLLQDLYEWGDINMPKIMSAPRVTHLIMTAYLADDPINRYIGHWFWDNLSSQRDYPTLYLDPLGTKTPPTDEIQHVATGRAVAYWQSGWSTDSIFYAAYIANKYTYEHPLNALTSFSFGEGGEWDMDTSKTYYDTGQNWDRMWNNAWRPHGALDMASEARGLTNYGYSPNEWFYVSGSTGGAFTDGGRNAGNVPPDWVKEYSFDNLMVKHADGTKTLFHYIRQNSTKDQRNIGAYSRYAGIRRQELEAVGAKHQFRYFTRTDEITQTGDRFQWTLPSGRSMSLRTNMGNYTDHVYDHFGVFCHTCFDDSRCRNFRAAQPGSAGPTDMTACPEDFSSKPRIFFRGNYPNKPSEIGLTSGNTPTQLNDRYVLVLQDETSIANPHFLTYLNTFHTGSNESRSEVISTGPEDVMGAMITTGSERVVAVFSAEPGINLPDTKSLPGYQNDLDELGRRTYFNPDEGRHDKIKQNRYLKDRIAFIVPTDEEVTVHVHHLDPARDWFRTINGGVAVSINESEGGVDSSKTVFTIPADLGNGDHEVVIYSTSTCSTTDWRGCSCLNPEPPNDSCTAKGWHCVDSICSQEPSEEEECSASNKAGCTTQAECEANHIAGCWRDGQCHGTREPSCVENPNRCQVNDPDECGDQEACELLDYHWDGSECLATAPDAVCGAQPNCPLCTTAATCQANSTCHWNSDPVVMECQNEPPIIGSPQTTTVLPSKDAYISGGSNAAVNYGSTDEGNLKTTESSGADTFSHVTLVSFDLRTDVNGKTLQPNSPIIRADVQFTLNGSQFWNKDYFACKLLRPTWDETATGENYKTGSAWNTPLARGNDTDVDCDYTTGTGAILNLKTVSGSVGDTVTYKGGQPFIDYVKAQIGKGSIDLAFFEELNETSTAPYHSSECGSASCQPTLILEFKEPSAPPLIPKNAPNGKRVNVIIYGTTSSTTITPPD